MKIELSMLASLRRVRRVAMRSMGLHRGRWYFVSLSRNESNCRRSKASGHVIGSQILSAVQPHVH